MNRSRSGQPAGPRPSAAETATAPVHPPADEPALDHVCFAIGRAYYAYLGMLEGVLREAELDQYVRPGTGHILFALFEQDNRTIKDLVDRAGLSYSTLSGMVSQLRRARLVTCRRDAADGRSVRVRLTSLGRSLELKCRGALARVDEIMLAGISQSRLRVTRNALRQMTDAMREHETLRRVKKKSERDVVPPEQSPV
ncbi:MAG TPA: MarR family winged helix-turn-helix transcriptional regulator [Thermoguttaceae bacterium]|nr:MarR family winged helix-turn-helix transcriptional regulator [Thermoguttaceae bacterium]